jgi:hypothetical protein
MESYMSWDELGVSRWKELEALRLLQRSMPKARIKNDRLDLRLGEVEVWFMRMQILKIS